MGYQYDTEGNLTALTLLGRTAHVFRYGEADRQTAYEPPDLGG